MRSLLLSLDLLIAIIAKLLLFANMDKLDIKHGWDRLRSRRYYSAKREESSFRKEMHSNPFVYFVQECYDGLDDSEYKLNTY